jgi:hypothetical protein
MTDYRAFVLGKVGQILKRHEFDAADDVAAMEHARQYVTSSDVEVWRLERLVGLLRPNEAI